MTDKYYCIRPQDLAAALKHCNARKIYVLELDAEELLEEAAKVYDASKATARQHKASAPAAAVQTGKRQSSEQRKGRKK